MPFSELGAGAPSPDGMGWPHFEGVGGQPPPFSGAHHALNTASPLAHGDRGLKLGACLEISPHGKMNKTEDEKLKSFWNFEQDCVTSLGCDCKICARNN